MICRLLTLLIFFHFNFYEIYLYNLIVVFHQTIRSLSNSLLFLTIFYLLLFSLLLLEFIIILFYIIFGYIVAFSGSALIWIELSTDPSFGCSHSIDDRWWFRWRKFFAAILSIKYELIYDFNVNFNIHSILLCPGLATYWISFFLGWILIEWIDDDAAPTPLFP